MINAWTRFVQNVTDIKKAVDYYVNTLGWQEPWYFGNPPEFAGVYGFSEMEFCLDRENCIVHGHPIDVTVVGVEELFERHRKREVRIVRELHTQPWGYHGYFPNFSAVGCCVGNYL